MNITIHEPTKIEAKADWVAGAAWLEVEITNYRGVISLTLFMNESEAKALAAAITTARQPIEAEAA
jgi:hypothetical protein